MERIPDFLTIFFPGCGPSEEHPVTCDRSLQEDRLRLPNASRHHPCSSRIRCRKFSKFKSLFVLFCLAKTFGLPFDDLEIVLMSIKFSSTWFVLSVWKKLPVLFSVFLGGRLVWTLAWSRCTVKWDLGGFSGFSGWDFSHSWAPTFHQKVTSLDCKSGQDGNNSLAQNGWGSPWWILWNRNLSKSPCIASMSCSMHYTLLSFFSSNLCHNNVKKAEGQDVGRYCRSGISCLAAGGLLLSCFHI